ncbi:type II toxin-antitoxin system RelE family toxin [Nonomuraea guangzhouensis]|uniref:Type II toxin-antitoxin system RelE/ParE family toxin n=1 Tax=Nonomuraea guangzhouensis TaxID=1291555 RepID=A0ABW4G8T3_9ACTN|nr:hypothetical protein [Nonomuraea guangzhouensis]
MKRLLHVDVPVREILGHAAPGLRTIIADTLFDLAEDPEPLAAVPYGGIPSAWELRTDTFRVIYTHSADHVSIWVLQINT